MTNPKGDDFRKYREMAPERMEDEDILNLIKKFDGGCAAITAAIENIWHDLSDGKAVGEHNEWNTTSKSKSKKDAIAAQQLADRGGGRGGRGPQSGGRGPGGRGDRVGGRGPGGPAPGRGGGLARPTGAAPSSHQSTARPVAVAAEQPVAPAAVAAVATGGWGAATTSAPTATAVSGGSSGWGSGGTTLAEKLKQAEIQKLLPPPAPVVEVNVVDENESSEIVEGSTAVAADAVAEKVSRRSRGRTPGPAAVAVVETVTVTEVEEIKEAVFIEEESVQELVAEVVELSVVEPVIEEVVEIVEVQIIEPVIVPVAVIEPIPVVQEIPIVSAPKAFLKMGKWEAPVESSSFQFGSFGNYSTDDSMSVPAPWGGAVAENEQQIQSDTIAAVWGANGSSNIDTSASSSSGPSPMSSLFPAPKGLGSVSSEGSPSAASGSHQNARYDQQKPSAPPGLEITKPLARQDSRSTAPGQSQTRGKHETNPQQQQLQQQQQQQQYQQPQYQQQAPAAAPAAARGQPAAPSSMLYGYAPGFESQYQQTSYGHVAPAVAPPATGSPVASTGAVSTQGQGIAPGAPQALQYGPPPGMPNHYNVPYYGSPYYGSQYFYGQPLIPNHYYNQGRGDYQTNRYGSDPYAPGGQYPNLYHQGGGFPDQGMPMQQHPSMSQQTQVQSGAAAAPGAASASGQGKQQKEKVQIIPQQQDPNQGYGYNPYNSRDAQWQQYQGWNAPMMGFPGGSPTGAGGPQGFSQPPQQQQQQQQQQSGQGQRPSSSGYGGPSGQGQQGQGQQSFSRGPGVPNASGPPSGGSAGQHW